MGTNASTLTGTRITEDVTVARRKGRQLRPLRLLKLVLMLTPRQRHHQARVPLRLATLLLRRPAAQVLVEIALALKDFPINIELAITEHLKTTYI